MKLTDIQFGPSDHLIILTEIQFINNFVDMGNFIHQVANNLKSIFVDSNSHHCHFIAPNMPYHGFTDYINS